MKAIVIKEAGGIDKLLYEEVETPKPGPGQVLVRIKAAGMNHLDHDVREGTSGFPVALPHVPGIEGCGEVVGLGAGVADTKIGDRVSINLLDSCGACANCLTGDDHLCLRPGALGVTMWGTYAEYVCCRERQLTPMPDGLSFEDAAAGHLCFSTAWHMAVTLGQVKAGMDVLVNAAGSGVGTSAIQIAKLHGARVIASAGSDAKLEMARGLGADDTINYNTQDLAARP
jgi:NADPH:quinone reductase-like Zn-dependent oxidoreductase